MTLPGSDVYAVVCTSSAAGALSVPSAAPLMSFSRHRDKMQMRMSHSALSGEFVRMAP